MKQFFENRIVRFILSAGTAALLLFLCPPCLSKITLGFILLILLVFVNASAFFARFNWLTQSARIIVGCLFIFSGFIKSNDPTGFSYKLGEYFDVFAEDTAKYTFLVAFFHGMKALSLFWAILVCLTEVALGFMILIGLRVRLTLWLLLLQIVFFTFLTFYSACFNKVTHCGCFGDAIQLTPWESFSKDLVLMVLITILWIGEDNIQPVFGRLIGIISTILIIAGSILFPLYAWYYLPPIDFRPYGPGKNLCEEMKPGPNYKQAEYQTTLIYRNKQTRELKEFTQQNYPWQDTLHWEWADSKPKLIKAAVDEPKIVDLKITNPESGEDLTDSILKNQDYHFILVVYDIDETNKKVQGRVNDFAALCDKDKKQFIGLTATPAERTRDFRHEVQAMYPFLSCDQTVLKTMIRSNPGLILMKGCNVIANWPYHSFPSYNDVKQRYFNQR
jgi:uncharacterized membrane protein YphA (DoxX/SURF4 family)